MLKEYGFSHKEIAYLNGVSVTTSRKVFHPERYEKDRNYHNKPERREINNNHRRAARKVNRERKEIENGSTSRDEGVSLHGCAEGNGSG